MFGKIKRSNFESYGVAMCEPKEGLTKRGDIDLCQDIFYYYM